MELERPLFGQVVRQVVRLKTEQLEACLAIQRQAGGTIGLGQVMREQGLITREQIMQVLQLQARWVATAMQEDVGAGLPRAMKLSLCLPAYNEAANIEDTMDGACAMLPEFVRDFEIVVVDDGSRDATAEIVARYAEREPRVRLVSHGQNRGYGAAVSSGLRAASGDLIMFTDADGQFSLLDLPTLLAEIDDADLVIGYRYRRADPRYRLLNAWAWNRLIRLVLGVKVRDLDCAFKLFRRDVVEQLQLTSTGAGINAEILVQCVRGGLRMTEVPVAHYPRSQGTPTGAAFRVILRAFRELPRLWKYRFSPPLSLQRVRAAAETVSDVPSPLSQRPDPVPAVKTVSGYDLDLSGYGTGSKGWDAP
jgi:hypothetical protein